MNEAKMTYKKADLIRDMVLEVFPKYQTEFKEIYVQECSRIMDISRQVWSKYFGTINSEMLQGQ
jgi:DNA primase